MARKADPMGQIITYMMRQPLAIVEQALSTCRAIVSARRQATTEAKAAASAAPPRKRVRPSRARSQAADGPAPPTITVVEVPAVPATEAPAAPEKRRRGRPPIVTGATPAMGTGTTTAQ